MARSSRSFAWILIFAVWTLLLVSEFAQVANAHGGDEHDDDGSDDGGSEPVNLKRAGLIRVKIYCLIIIFFATFLPGISPYYLRWSDTFLALGIQFAAGVFLATAMLHFLSDSNETFEDLTTKTYPFAMMLAVSGYLMTMLADVIVQNVVSRQQSKHERNEIGLTDVENAPAAGKVDDETGLTNCCAKPATNCTCNEGGPNPPEVQNIVNATLIHKASLGDAILLIFALCFHSVFEGIAIGVAGTERDAWRNLWTITLHKVFAAISMGIALLRIMPNRPLISCAAYAFAFAISSPVGIGIGIAIDSTTQGSTANWIYAISMGLATGVFIYVAINHLLGKSHVNSCRKSLDKPFFKFVAVTLGAGVIFVVMIWDT